MKLQLPLQAWAAWSARGIESDRWLDLLTRAPEESAGDVRAPVDFVDARERRRLKPLARAVVHVAHEAAGKSWGDIPLILFSAHGEVHRSFRMLTDIAKNEPVSPAEFSHSVHNAIAGQLSIIAENQNSIVSLADSGEGIGGPLLEAAMLLETSQSDSVMVICYDEPIPEFYGRFTDDPSTLIAIALLFDRRRALGELAAARQSGQHAGEAAWRQMVRLADCLAHGNAMRADNPHNSWNLHVRSVQGR